MRFLADENFPGEAIAKLNAIGHDVVWVRSVAPGISDADIMAWAAREERIVLTFDKDFGELAWRTDLPSASGIILFRLPMPPAAQAGDNLVSRIGERNDWAGHFSVIEPGRIRMRPLGGG
jgi:Domain of unknown function (DUF5615)